MGTRMVTGTYDEDGNRTILDEAVKALAVPLDEERVRAELAAPPPIGGGDDARIVEFDIPSISSKGVWPGDELDVEAFKAAAREWVGDANDVALLVHPLEGETVVDALRRHFEAAGMGTVTVATADGPRDVDVPAALAGVAVIESTLVPAGEIRLAPRAAGGIDLVVLPSAPVDIAGKLVLR